MASSVKALYSYSYQYDGTEVSFAQGDDFKLLSKASNEWWHVRRWRGGVAQDIYVPANYVAEVEEPLVVEENPTYENLEELLQKQRLAREKKEKAEKPKPQQQPAEKAPVEMSADNMYAVVGPRLTQSKEPPESSPSTASQDQAKSNEYDQLAQVAEYASSLPRQGGVGSYIQTASAPIGADGYFEPIVVMVPTRQNSSGKKDPSQAGAQPPLVAVKPAPTEDKVKPGPAVASKSIADGWTPGYALPTTTTKTRSMTTATSLDNSDGDGTASLDRYTRASTPERTASVRRPAGGPTVRPKLSRPMSMHMEAVPTAATAGEPERDANNVTTPKSSDALSLSSNTSSLKMALEQKFQASKDPSTSAKQGPPPTVPKPIKVPLAISAELANKLNRVMAPPSAGTAVVSVPATAAVAVGAGGGEDVKAGNKMVKTPSPDEKVSVGGGGWGLGR